MSRLLIHGGRLIDPASGTDTNACLLIEDGLVAAAVPQDGPELPSSLQTADAERLDATGLIVSPGFVDTHVSVREPGYEEDETIATAAAAALAGGFTTIASLPDTNPVVDNRAFAEFVKLQADRANQCRVYPLGAVTKGSCGEELAEIGQLVEGGAVGFSDGKIPLANAEVMRRALEYTRMFGVPVLHHAIVPELAEGGVMHEGFVSTRLGLRGVPAAAQDIMTGRDIALAEMTEGRVHIMGVTTRDSVSRIRAAQQKSIRVTADVTPHHLLMTDAEMERFDTLVKCNPPLRSQEHIDALIEGLKDGTICAISSDHQPLAIEKKAVELDRAPFGICGLETALAICVEALISPGHLSWPELIARLTIGPAEVIGVVAGQLSAGSPADITLIDPAARWTIRAGEFRSLGRNTPFDQRPAAARVVGTLVGGEIRYRRESAGTS